MATYFVGLTGATIKDVEENKAGKQFSFRIESEWDGLFAFRTSSEEDFTKFMKQLKVAHEWCNKAAPADDKGLARTSHCIPHRFATENLLLKRCRYCTKIITEFRAYRCIRESFLPCLLLIIAPRSIPVSFQIAVTASTPSAASLPHPTAACPPSRMP